MSWFEVEGEFKPNFIYDDDECFCYLTHTSGGFRISQHNQLVFNFKKPLSDVGQYYKQRAINDFVTMLHKSLNNFTCTIIPCPTSKPRSHKEFDNRLDRTAEILGSLSSNYDIQYCLDTIRPVTPSHLGGSRDVGIIKQNTSFTPPTKSPLKRIVLIDDVLTSGAHFRAYKDIISANYPDRKIAGVFLARHFSDNF